MFRKTRLSFTHEFCCVKARKQVFSSSLPAQGILSLFCARTISLSDFYNNVNFFISWVLFLTHHLGIPRNRAKEKSFEGWLWLFPIHTAHIFLSWITPHMRSPKHFFSKITDFLDQAAGADLMCRTNFSARDPVLLSLFLT